jgi:uncharacterized protein
MSFWQISAMRNVICNTSPLLYLHQLGQLHLLPALYERIVVPETVCNELREGARLGHSTPDAGSLPWVEIQRVETTLLRLVIDLDAREREVLALGSEHPHSLLLLDDDAARRYATMIGLTFTGTLGVLIRAKERALLPEVRPIFDNLQKLGFRAAPHVRATVLRLVGELE